MPGPIFLVPLDGSDATEHALRRAAHYIRLVPDAKVRLLAVLDPSFLEIPAESLEGMDLEPSEHEVFQDLPQAQRIMHAASEALHRAGYAPTPERLYRTGKPHDVIVAEALRADILVMHRLDAQGITERLRGSMTERIARHAHCHVWLVDPATEPRHA